MEQLAVEIRNIFGKKLENSRKQGKLPAVVYGRKKETTPLFVDLKEFKKRLKETGKSTIFKIKSIDSKIDSDVLIQEICSDPRNDELLHVDFYAVEMDKPIIATVKFVFMGEAPAEKELGGIIVKVLHEIDVEALPKDLPSELKIDLSNLKTFEDQITIKDIELPKGVKILAKDDDVVVLISEPQGEIVEEPVMKIEDVEVEKRGKKEEETIEEK
ncbi:50S ribosomal protein L25 [Patescibacteria group bacterium]|nr:50S ribosomal protein L25 [Patescibacteria group bacterium]